MDAKINRLHQLIKLMESKSDTPWWVVCVLRDILDIELEIKDIMSAQNALDDALVKQQAQLTSLSTRYSELMYKVKSGE